MKRFFFGEEQFNHLFPFYILISRDLTIASFGTAVGKLFSLQKGQLFAKAFEMYGHTAQTLSFEYMESLNGYEVIFKSADERKLQFRGEFQYNRENDQVLFAGAPLSVPPRPAPVHSKEIDSGNPKVDLKNEPNQKEVGSNNVNRAASINEPGPAPEKFSKIIGETINPVAIYDVSGKVEWVNHAFEKLSGFTLAEVKGTLPLVYMAGRDTNLDTFSYLLSQYRKLLPINCEILCYSKTGRPFWVQINGQPLFDKHGDVIQFFTIEEDITARKEAEAGLTGSEENPIKYTLEKMADNVWEYDFKAGDAN